MSSKTFNDLPNILEGREKIVEEARPLSLQEVLQRNKTASSMSVGGGQLVSAICRVFGQPNIPVKVDVDTKSVYPERD